MRICLLYVFAKVPIRTFLRSDNCRISRLAHSQHATHCLVRLKQPRVPITNGSAIQIPQYWTKQSYDLQLHCYEE